MLRPRDYTDGSIARRRAGYIMRARTFTQHKRRRRRKQILKCGWCKKQRKFCEVKLHSCTKDYRYIHITPEKEFYPQDDDERIYFLNINENCFYGNDDQTQKADESKDKSTEHIHTQYTLHLENAESKETVILNANKETHDRAVNDLSYATNLLTKHTKLGSKSYISQSSNIKNKLLILRDEYNEQFEINVDDETYKKAFSDAIFATELLTKHKKLLQLQEENCLSASSTTSFTEKETPAKSINTFPEHKNYQAYMQHHVDNTLEEKDDVLPHQGGRYNWSTNDSLLLIHSYKEYDFLYSKNKITQRKMFQMIANKMKEEGYVFSPIQC